ncbi:YgiW/YdeI family stress tolerance OB fold protein [Orbus mooreae]|uniref:YgiW/YdeI family stress tolerance OB fold protein n=1 Tax=Orbus mooreae TaxID=3074107 RepID=UPI00370D0F35
MKKLIQLALIVTLGISGAAIAKPLPQGGFNDGTPAPAHQLSGFNAGEQTITTVEQAKQMNKDAWVTLQGNIVKQIGDEDYLFRDSTGEINVEIDHKYWRGQTVTPNDTVQITGEVDHHRYKPTDIDVKRVVVLSPAPPVK